MEDKKVQQIKRLKKIKLGNIEKYSFEVPKEWVEQYLGLKEGDMVDITIEKAKKVNMPRVLIESFRKEFPELNDYSDNQLNAFFSQLRFEKILHDDMSEEETKKVVEKFESLLEQEEGKKFTDDYRIFKKIVYDEKKISHLAFNIPDEGIREEYRIGLEIIKNRKQNSQASSG